MKQILREVRCSFLLTTLMLFLGCLTPKTINKQEPVIQKSDTATFGASTLHFWHELTPFEEKTLKNIDQAKNGDPKTLFALGLFASGNVRDSSTHAKYLNQILQFIEKISPEIEKQQKPIEKGRVLFDSMCTTFFKRRFFDNDLKGYSFNQSQLSEIFRSAKYNCVSSSMLYIILARFFNLDVRGVILPSHVFVQLNLPNGNVIEIETTIRSGYNFVHDKAFFTTKKKKWFTDRMISPITYEQYKNRKIVAPWKLLVYNMNNQHTDIKRMSYTDRSRLLEAMGYIHTEDKYSQELRLTTYNNECIRLKKTKNYTAMLAMFTKVEPWLKSLHPRWQEDDHFRDLLVLIEQWYANTLEKNGKNGQAIMKIIWIVENLREGFSSYEMIINNLKAIVQGIVEQHDQSKDYSRALALMAPIKDYPKVNALYTNSARLIHEYYSLDLLKKQQWLLSFNQSKKAIKLAKTSSDSSRIVQNLKAMLYDLAITNKLKLTHDSLIFLLEKFDDFEPTKDYTTLLKADCFQAVASDFWKLEKWGDVVIYNEKALALPIPDEKKAVIIENIHGASYNWALGHFNKKEYAKAKEVVEGCIKKWGSTKKFDKLLKQIEIKTR